MSKHTPGPWYMWDTDGLIGVGKNYGDEADLLNAVSQSNRPLSEDRANMRLIAAAPDLLEALKGMVSLFPADVEDEGSGFGFNENLKAKYRASIKAIARAKGESQ